MVAVRKYSEEELRRVVSGAKFWLDVADLLGVKSAGGVSKAARLFGIDVSHIKGPKSKEYRLERRRRGLEAGNCSMCFIRPPRGDGFKWCEKCANSSGKRIKTKRSLKIAAGICFRCTRPARKGAKTCWFHLQKSRDISDRLKRETMDAYGGKCSCCGEDNLEFLSIDHIRGDGAEHRRRNFGRNCGAGGATFYRWLKKQGYPQDNYRCLCANCNLSARFGGGICVHQRAQV